MTARHGRPDRSHRCGHMPTARIVGKIKRPAKLATYLEADHVGAGNANAFNMTCFGERDKTRKKRDTRMATHRGGRIIEVKGVCCDTIEKRSAFYRRLLSTSPQACHAVVSSLPTDQRRRKRFGIVPCASHGRLVLRGDSHGHCVCQRATTLKNVIFAK